MLVNESTWPAQQEPDLSVLTMSAKQLRNAMGALTGVPNDMIAIDPLDAEGDYIARLTGHGVSDARKKHFDDIHRSMRAVYRLKD